VRDSPTVVRRRRREVGSSRRESRRKDRDVRYLGGAIGEAGHEDVVMDWRSGLHKSTVGKYV